jgi:hypothetical protein
MTLRSIFLFLVLTFTAAPSYAATRYYLTVARTTWLRLSAFRRFTQSTSHGRVHNQAD